MKKFYQTRLFRFTGLVLGVLIWLANAGNPPNGRTGAPFDGSCADCHNGGNFNGNVEITGLPSTIEPNTTYPLVITLTATSGSPTTGGFQAVFVDNNNGNCGDLTAGNAQSGTEFSNGREYIDQRGDKAFSGGSVSWNFNWKSPVSVAGNTVKVYYIGNFTNNNNNDSGDFPVAVSQSYAFSGPPPMTASITDIQNVSCFGANNGSLTVTPDGGAPPYTYLWSNNQTSQTAINLGPGTYTVTVTSSGGGGTATASASITQPTQLNVTATSSNTITCAQPTATLTASASGGTPNYSYVWFNNDTDNQTTVDAGGSYSVTATDLNGCTKVTTVNVSSNTAVPNATAGPDAVLTCSQTSVVLNGQGSSSGTNFSYTWTTTNGNIVSGANTLTPTVNAPGTYILAVTNTINGCTATDAAVVTANQTPPTAAATGGQLTCTTTSVQLNVTTNATQPGFVWTGPNGFTSTLQNPSVTEIGTYQVVVTNGSNNCTATSTANVTINNTPPTVTATASGQLTCSVSSIVLSGNSNGVSYSWTGPNGFSSTQQDPTVGAPGTYTLSATGSNGCIASDTAVVQQNTTPPGATASANGQLNCVSTTVQLNGGSSGSNPSYSWTGPNNFTSTLQNPVVNTPGDYSLLVTSGQNGCTSSASTTVVQNIAPPTASAVTPVSLTCVSATVQLDGTASSQGPSFTALWTTADGNIISGATTLTPVVDEPGTYKLMVTNNNNGCMSTSTVTVTQNPPVSANATVNNNVSCNGGTDGSVSVAVSGGNGSYTYLWSTGATSVSVTGLSAGTYSVSVTDGESCTAVSAVTVSQPLALSTNASATGETAAGANDGTASAAPAGGSSPYSYLWSNSATTASISNLAPGNYTVSVTDANNCTAVQTVTVNSFNCSINATISTQNSSCNGDNNGTASVSLTGAAEPVAYLWSNSATTQSVGNLAPGTYTVQITDANNCPAQLSATITEPPVLLANAVATNETAAGANDGTATAAPTGGTSPYTYVWNTGATTPGISALAPGTYTVSVQDNNNCLAVQTVVVNSFNCAISANITTANVACNGQNNGQATVTLNGGALPYTYLWSNGNTTATADQLAAGVYFVSVTDANNCLVVTSAAITEPDVLVAAVAAISNVICPEDQTGSISLNITGGTLPYQLQWSGGQGGQNLAPGTYTVSVTDNNNCSATTSATIVSTDNEPPVLNCPAASLVACPGESATYNAPTASDNCNLNGAQPVLTAGLASGSVFPVGTTTIVYNIQDASGNNAQCSFEVIVEANPGVSVDDVVNESNSASNGSISISIEGGAPATFLWEKEGVFYSSDEDLTGLGAGTYSLVVTFANGCTQVVPDIQVNNVLGAANLATDWSLRLTPNPATSFVRIEAQGLKLLKASLYDMQGQLVVDFDPDNLEAELSLNNVPAGYYYVVISAENGIRRALKLVKAE